MRLFYSKSAFIVATVFVLLQLGLASYSWYEHTVNPPDTFSMPPVVILYVPYFILSGIFREVFDLGKLFELNPITVFIVPIILNGLIIYFIVFILGKIARYLKYLVS